MSFFFIPTAGPQCFEEGKKYTRSLPLWLNRKQIPPIPHSQAIGHTRSSLETQLPIYVTGRKGRAAEEARGLLKAKEKFKLF